jgi:hypothetical protein
MLQPLEGLSHLVFKRTTSPDAHSKYSMQPFIKLTPKPFFLASIRCALPRLLMYFLLQRNTVVLSFNLNKGCLFSKFVDAHGIAIPHTQPS